MFSRFLNALLNFFSSQSEEKALERRLCQAHSVEEIEYIQRNWHRNNGQFPLSH
jgi:hypothetical protein